MGLRDTILDMVPGDAARKLSTAIGNAGAGGKNDGHTTSGMDLALQNHADKMHPVDRPAVDPSQLGRNPDGSVSFPK